MENLRQTRSVNITSNNILEGLLPIENEQLHFSEEIPEISRRNDSTTDQRQADSSSTSSHVHPSQPE